MNSATDIPEALRVILRDFCHMESYETHELRSWHHDPQLKVKLRTLINTFRDQLADAIARRHITPQQFAILTADDCESNEEVVERLRKIEREVFGAGP
jgi:hypothetical protein